MLFRSRRKMNKNKKIRLGKRKIRRGGEEKKKKENKKRRRGEEEEK